MKSDDNDWTKIYTQDLKGKIRSLKSHLWKEELADDDSGPDVGITWVETRTHEIYRVILEHLDISGLKITPSIHHLIYRNAILPEIKNRFKLLRSWHRFQVRLLIRDCPTEMRKEFGIDEQYLRRQKIPKHIELQPSAGTKDATQHKLTSAERELTQRWFQKLISVEAHERDLTPGEAIPTTGSGKPARKLPAKKLDMSNYFDDADLTERQRQCLSLKHEHGLSNVEIGRRLGIDRTTVAEHLKAGENRIKNARSFEGKAKKKAIKKPGSLD